MKNSKLLLLLGTFTDSEYREFAKFLASPYFNQKEDVRRFYALLRKYAPLFSDKKVTKERIMQQLFPKKEFDNKSYKYLTNLLFKLAERYVALKETERRPMIQDYHLLNAYVNRGLEKNYNFVFQKNKLQQEQSTARDADYYYRQYLLRNVDARFYAKKAIRKNLDPTQALASALDIYYLSNKLKQTCHLISNQQIVSVSSDTRLIDEIIQHLDGDGYEDYPAIHLYHRLYKLLSMTAATGEGFSQIKWLMESYQGMFEKEEMKQVYLMLINYCIKQVTKGDASNYFLNELYGIYLSGISSGLLMENGHLSPWTYKNTIKAGLRLRKFEETEAFIMQYKDALAENFRQDAFHYNMADFYYYKQKPQKALGHLLHVEFSDIYYALGAKIMMLKIYYETGEEEALLSLLASFQNYLRRNKLISHHVRDTYLNFLRCLSRVLKGSDKATLLRDIEKTSPLMEKAWLLQIANSIR